MVQLLGLLAFTDKGMDSTPGWGTKILQATGVANNNKQNRFILKKSIIIIVLREYFGRKENHL